MEDVQEQRQEIIEDMKHTLHKIDANKLHQETYRKKGNYSVYRVRKLFDSWKHALQSADIPVNKNITKKVTERQVRNEIREIQDSIDQPITHTIAIEKGTHIKAGTHWFNTQQILKDMRDLSGWIQKLQGHTGWFTIKQLSQILDTRQETVKSLLHELIQEAKNHGLTIHENGDSGGNGKRLYIKRQNYQYNEIKEKIPGHMHTIIDESVAKGMNPENVAAAIHYMQNYDVTQREAAEEYGTTPTTVRKHYKRIQKHHL